MRYTLFLWLIVSVSFAQSRLEKTDTNWTLFVNEQPFEVKGVTFGYDKDVSNYDAYFKDLNYLGVNTIRTWATGDNTPQLLDAAHKHGIKVLLGIWMRHGRPGMEDDDSFNYLEDEKGKEAMYNNALKTVEQYKNHPAVLFWGVGNEVYLNTATDEEKEAYSKLLERICSAIKKKDNQHLILSVEAWTFGLDWWQKYVPSIDIYGLNSYGAGANYLATELEKRNINKPYIITEFGVTGEWDIKQETNGIKIEPTDQQKYDAIAKGYPNWIKSKPQCLGVYVFHYGNGNTFAAAWLNIRFKNKYRPQYWAIREAYTGKTPENSTPVISTFELSKNEDNSSTWLPLDLKVTDLENDSLAVNFYYNQRTGSRRRRDQLLKLKHRGDLNSGFEIELPQVNGAIKVYATATDSYNNLGMASSTILISDAIAKERKYLVPKIELPFYVYKDNIDTPYSGSAFMGNYKEMSVKTNHKEHVHSGENAIKIHYNVIGNWYGIAFVDPANDWGDILGGYDISDAKTFSFWAKASDNGVKTSIGFGLIDKDKKYPDTAKKAINVVLTTKWKKYNIKTKKLDLSCIRSGLVVFSNGQGFSHDIYIDDVVFE